VAEVTDKHPLFDALGFSPDHAFLCRDKDPLYFDFAAGLTERAGIRLLVESDTGVQTRHAGMLKQLAQWWTEHSRHLADLPQSRDLNRVRAGFLDTFVRALLRDPAGGASPPLDRFKLAGIIATWWTDTLPDFKTLLENGFSGVVDGWVDAIADAVEDDETAGPAFDPFGHKLVRRTMDDYVERIAAAKADFAQLKGEKEAFERSNAPDEFEEEELSDWSYVKDLERQMRELKADNKDARKTLARLERTAAKVRSTAEQKRAAAEAKIALRPVFDQLAVLEEALTPYEQVKDQLAKARARHRTLIDEFVSELKSRCGALTSDQNRDLVLELFAQEVQAGLDTAAIEKRRELVRFIEGLWGKYRVTLTDLRGRRATTESQLQRRLAELGYQNEENGADRST
jgi:type I restriction enzyme M protein